MKTRTILVGGVLALAVAAILGSMAGLVRAEGAPKWTGAYVGASVGYGATTTQTGLDVVGFGNVLAIDGLGTSGGSLGLAVGADLQMEQFVIGAFFDYVGHDQTWSASSPLVGTLATLDLESQWTIGARAGVAVGNALVYGLVGYTEMQTSDLSIPLAAVSFAVPDLKGITLGGGVEVALGGGLSAALEYRHTDFDKVSIDVLPGLAAIGMDSTMDEVRARLSYKFGVGGSSLK